ncbi:hypothetical protein DFQ14_101294 [Halopolyspora algeriensis]|uniref:DUF4190 domain-containing protein n=2 Tax=Halopolyspora algeriensis TaxID=1500506 RepID=A0A368W161_9ACTN|nr:hypothetical protein DFQ14_101294 [Halopolyspora algeriensis]TQM48045.1 hypothetical protein FHU43_2998 [Halopolyspora algeriensis]
MGTARELPAENRPGKQAWLGPISLALGLVSWVIPAASWLVALGAIVCGAVSMSTRTEYRVDWTAVVGIGAGAARGLVSLLVLIMTASGY